MTAGEREHDDRLADEDAADRERDRREGHWPADMTWRITLQGGTCDKQVVQTEPCRRIVMGDETYIVQAPSGAGQKPTIARVEQSQARWELADLEAEGLGDTTKAAWLRLYIAMDDVWLAIVAAVTPLLRWPVRLTDRIKREDH